jgi:branched-chain amino acid transport system substrate-binding protein
MRKFVLVALAGQFILTAFLVACQAAYRPYKCTDPLGCLEIPPGSPLDIGMLLAISGDYASIGIDSRRGVELAAADQGAIKGHILQLFLEGTDCSSQAARSAATELALTAQLVAVIGPTCTEEAQVAAQILSDAGLVMISPSAGGEVTAPGFFRTFYSASFSGSAAETAMQDLDAHRAITITDDVNDSNFRIGSFTSALQKLGESRRQVVGTYDVNNYQAFISDLTPKFPDFLYLSASPTLAGQVVTHVEGNPESGALAVVGSENLFSPDFLQSAGDAARGVYLIGPDVTTFSQGYPRFVNAYLAAYGQPPISVFHAYAYDAAGMLFQTIRRTSVLDRDGTLHIPRQGLRRALSSLFGFPGLTGNLSCSASGNCAATSVHLGIYRIIDPNPAAWDTGSNPKLIYSQGFSK